LEFFNHLTGRSLENILEKFWKLAPGC